jgi:MauM/NapG family ferredoxin protein
MSSKLPRKLSRRGFLTGRVETATAPASGPEDADTKRPQARATSSGAAPELPRVISWLADYSEETPMEGRRGQVAPRARDSQMLAMHRPPGAVAEEDFLARCTSCGDCITACPHNAIQKAPARFRIAAGTPYIDAAQSPCLLCEDTPCIPACPEDALVEDGDTMGTAHISRFDCLNTLGTQCSICIERCPVDGAIRKGSLLGEPLVSASLCVGCGICQYACPAPNTAIGILPNRNRRTPAASSDAGNLEDSTDDG